MNRPRISSVLALTLAAISYACAPEAETNTLAAVHQRSSDVQVLSVRSSSGLCYRPADNGSGTCSGMKVVLTQDCDVLGSNVSGDYVYKTLECRQAAEAKTGLPMISGLVVAAQGPTSTGIVDSNTAHFSNVVKIAVRSSAYDSPSFTGIGFYVSNVTHRYYEPAPAGGNDEGRFLAKSDLAGHRVGQVTLKDGSTAYVFEVMTAVRTAMGGSSTIASQYFRPNARFVANGEEYWNWDLVESDYRVGLAIEFDRSADVLQ